MRKWVSIGGVFGAIVVLIVAVLAIRDGSGDEMELLLGDPCATRGMSVLDENDLKAAVQTLGAIDPSAVETIIGSRTTPRPIETIDMELVLTAAAKVATVLSAGSTPRVNPTCATND